MNVIGIIFFLFTLFYFNFILLDFDLFDDWIFLFYYFYFILFLFWEVDHPFLLGGLRVRFLRSSYTLEIRARREEWGAGYYGV